jgi:hypothetical protein
MRYGGREGILKSKKRRTEESHDSLILNIDADINIIYMTI